MRYFLSLNAILLIYFATAGASMATPLDGLKKVGEAKLSVYFWDVYQSTLYNSTGEYQPEEFPMVLNIDYLRDIDAEDLIESTEDEWKKLGIQSTQSTQWINMLKDIFPDIKKGDTILLHVKKSKQSEFYFNDQSIGVIDDVEFGSSFLRIWLDKNASYPKVRNKLIGL
jgi:hypothetical protein